MSGAGSQKGRGQPVAPVRVVALLLLVVLAAIYGLSVTRGVVSLDTVSTELSSWRISQARTPSLAGVDDPLLQHPNRDTWIRENGAGEPVVGRTPGGVLVGIPSYLILGGDAFSVIPGELTAALLAAVASVLLFLCLAGLRPVREALGATLAFALATPVWSVSANAIWPHTLTVLGITGMAWGASRGRWWAVGIFGAVTVWGRLHAAVIVAVLGLALAVARRRPGIAVRVGTCGAVAVLGLCLWDRWVYGSWSPLAAYTVGPFAAYAGEHWWDPVNQLGFWIAPDRGIFVWTPILLVLLPALVRSWRGLPDWSRWLLIGGLAYSILQVMLNRFSGGDYFYGYRISLELLASAAPAYGMAAHRAGRTARLLVAPVLALQFIAIAIGAISDGLFVGADDVWRRNAFVEGVAAAPLPMTIVILVGVTVAGWLGARYGPGRATSADRPGDGAQIPLVVERHE